MVQPNAAAKDFTFWMLNISSQRLSSPQRVLTEQVYNSSVTGVPITNQQWYNFNLFAAWRNTYYIVYRDYAVHYDSPLLTNIALAINFEGNTTNLVTGAASVDNSVSFGLMYGKVDKGAFYDGVTSLTTITPYVTTTDCSFNFWYNPQFTANAYNGIFTHSPGDYGFYFHPVAQTIIFYYTGDNNPTSAIPLSAWTMVTGVITAGSMQLYINAVASGAAFAIPAGLVLDTIGGDSGIQKTMAYLDCLSCWDRALLSADINLLYNSGAGLQYPF